MSSRRKDRDIKKANYYVWYLGWKEVRGLWGREFTEPITKELVVRRAHEPLPKLTVEVNKKEVKVVQLVEKKKGKVEKVKYPPIPAKDVTYAVQALSPDMDVVSCIYLGYNPQTRCAVHVHVYRCDSPETAELFADHLTQLTEIPDHQERIFRIEADLVAKSQIMPRPSAFVGAADGDATSTIAPSTLEGRPGGYYEDGDYQRHANYDSKSLLRVLHPERESPQPGHMSPGRLSPGRVSPRHGRGSPRPDSMRQDSDEKDIVDIYDSVTDELKAKLKINAAPVLYPPKDYDTMHRSAGNMRSAEEIRRAHLSEDSAQGESERGSRESRGFSSGGSRNSGASPVPPEDEELRAITPRWKMTSQTYVPPSSPRTQSPVPEIIYDNAKPHQKQRPLSYQGPGDRSKSPVYGMARPLSPPPELKHNSYFPSSDTAPLPGYLGSPPLSPSQRQHSVSGKHSNHGSDDSGGASTSKKYTAATLGLTDVPRPSKGRPHDEGYISLDRRDPSRPQNLVGSAYFYDEAYGNYQSYDPRYADHVYAQTAAGMITSMPSLAPQMKRGYSDRRPMPGHPF